jgi:hypothetical protein
MIRRHSLMLLPLLATLAACGPTDEEKLAPEKSGKAQATEDRIVAKKQRHGKIILTKAPLFNCW